MKHSSIEIALEEARAEQERLGRKPQPSINTGFIGLAMVVVPMTALIVHLLERAL